MVSNWVGKSAIAIRSKLIPFLFLPKDHTTYYYYQGSLTTPGCQESVMWFVMTEKLTVSEAQVIRITLPIIRESSQSYLSCEICFSSFSRFVRTAVTTR